MGKPAYESVHEFDDDPDLYKYALGIVRSIPSEETLCQRMDDIGLSLRSYILAENIQMLRDNGIVPGKLPNGYVPVDIDVTSFDNSRTKKQGVSRTYKGCDGYAPIMAYIGTKGYPVNCELREGKQHCQKHTPEFLQETIRMCREIADEPLLVRLDSGNDAAENIGILIEAGCYFIIKRNLRKESKEGWLQMEKEHSTDVETPVKGKLFISAVTGSLSPIKQRMAQKKISQSVPGMKSSAVPLINTASSFWEATQKPEPGGQTLE